MVRVTRKKRRTTRRLYGLVFLVFLSAAAGVGLYKLSPSLLDIGRIFRHAADKMLEQSADITSAEPVLRGTVFDRNIKEMAVSYRLYSLYVRPAEITNAQEVVRILGDVTGLEEDHLHVRLNEAKSIINVADHLEQGQVDMIKNARLSGLYVKPVEERFYPEHETAAGLVGFTGEGIGLSGIEGTFDTLLQEGEFRTSAVPGIDFSEEQVLGREKVDVVVTIDIGMQKRIEKQLKGFLDKNQASKGIALLMDPRSGAVLAWASQPSYNPNYYWQIPGTERKSLFDYDLDPDLLRSLRVRIAASRKQGDLGNFLLPETVAVQDYGLSNEDIEKFGQFNLNDKNMECVLPATGQGSGRINTERETGRYDGVGPIEWAATAASFLNGGWRVSPYVLDAVYDHGRERIYNRPVKQSDRDRILSPSMGIKVRHDIVATSRNNEKNLILQADSVERIRKAKGISEHVVQEAVIGAIPAKSPEMLLLVVTKQDSLNPYPRGVGAKKDALKDFGKKLLTSLYDEEQKRVSAPDTVASMIPQGPDPANYNQFLISSKIDFQERGGRGTGRVAVMPQLVGLSLRKGLQRLNEYHVQVKVQGSGQIVSQMPGPGESLQGIGECVLTLASEI